MRLVARVVGMAAVILVGHRVLTGCIPPRPLSTGTLCTPGHTPDAGIARAAPMAAANVAEDWPFKCAALKVYSVESERDIRGYYMPVRCVPELSTYPGSKLADGGCVPGCVTEGKTACWLPTCEIEVTP